VLINTFTDIMQLQVIRMQAKCTVRLKTMTTAVLAVSKYELIWK